MAPFRNILVATDFGPTSEQAVELAADLATIFDAKLSVMHAYAIAVPIYPIALTVDVDGVAEAAKEAMDKAIGGLRLRCPGVRGVVRHGDAAHEILEEAESCNADLIVVGTHGHRGLSRVLLGSVAEKVVRLSTIPVLCVRARTLEGAELLPGKVDYDEDEMVPGAALA
ncbi:MAG: universal stress protein [Polyangiaceae bacterium]|nr:universal stress protein [Polyangiaceae bacterium]